MSFNLADLFEGVTDAVPDREAVVCRTADGATTRLTYADLEARANRLADHLTRCGIARGDHVGLHLYNGSEYLEGMLAAFKIGAVSVNVNYRYVVDELAYLLDNADLRYVITEEDLADRVREAADRLPTAPDVLTRGAAYEEALAAASAERPVGVERGSDDLYLLYTGGTTGMPKGVMWRHEDLFFGSLGGTGGRRVPRLEDPDRIGEWATEGTSLPRRLPLCPLMHGGAQWVALQAIYSGGTVLLSTDRRFDAAAALALVAEERASLIMVIGDAIARPLADELASAGGAYDLSALRVLRSSGAVFSAAVKAQLGELLPSVRIQDMFGASETGGQGQLTSAGDRSVGFVPDDHTTVLDADLRPVEPGSGVVGRLARTGNIPYGYYKDPDKTAATFPVVDGVRWSVPGDMATVAEDGTVSVLGRGSGSINTGGEKVYPEEVESALKSHPAVYDALVVGVPDERFGERVTAVVRWRDGITEEPTIDDLAEHCAGHISRFKVPRAVVSVDRIQRLPTGKPDYRWARREAEAAAV